MKRYRIVEHLRNRDWWGVSIDLVILIVGVFLGIQAANWNEARKDRDAGKSYLKRIAADLRSDHSALTERIAYWRPARDAGVRALDFAETGKLDRDSWRTLLDFEQAGQIWVYGPSDATYRELVGAGRLDLIRDLKLRKAISDYYVARSPQASLIFEEVPAFRRTIRGAIPYQIRRYIEQHCQKGISAGFGLRDCPPPGPPSTYEPALRRVAEDEALLSDLRYWVTVSVFRLQLAEQYGALTVNLADEIEAGQR